MPGPPPEARLLRSYRMAAQLSITKAAALTRYGPTLWRNYESDREDINRVALTLAEMAAVVGIPPGEMRSARPDAADELERLPQKDPPPTVEQLARRMKELEEELAEIKKNGPPGAAGPRSAPTGRAG